MSRYPIAWALTLVLAGTGAVSAAAAERRFALPDFDKIRVEGDVAVDVRSGRTSGAAATGDARALQALTLTVQNGTLYIRRARSTAPVERRLQASAAEGVPQVLVDARAVHSLALLGNGSARIDRLGGARPVATMDGNGSVEIGRVEAEVLALNVNGSGSLKVSGAAERARVVMLGDGLIEGTGLAVAALDLNSEGPVRAVVEVNGPARISARGGADIAIAGAPQCTVRQIGTNDVRCGSRKEAAAIR